MSIKKAQHGPGMPEVIVRRGRPLAVEICPVNGCGGTLTDVPDAKGKKVRRCGRCRVDVTSRPF